MNDISTAPEGVGDRHQTAALDDAELVRRTRAGDLAAFASLMRRYNQRLYRVARGILNGDADADDVVQDAYIRAFYQLHQFIDPGNFSAWLTRIAVNEALQRRRRFTTSGMDAADKGTALSIDHDTATARSSSSDPLAQVEALQIRQLLEQAIERLPAAFRTVFILRGLEQMTVAETAFALGLHEVTEKTRFHRAKASIRRDLSRRFDGEGLRAFGFDGARCDRLVAAVLQRLTCGPDPPR